MLESLKQEDLQFQELSPEEKQARGILARLTGPIASFTKGTRNGRKYSDKLWEKAFDAPLVKEMFKNGGLPGELQHPENRSETDPTKIAIMMPEPPKKDSKGHLVASVDILDTPCGQIAYQLGKYGFKFGISSRGEGDLITDFSGEESVDPDTYTLNAFDLVLIPACEDARLQFNESLNTKKSNKLRTILSEALANASDTDRRIMEEALDELDIDDNWRFVETYRDEDIYFDPESRKYIVGYSDNHTVLNSLKNAKEYIDRYGVFDESYISSAKDDEDDGIIRLEYIYDTYNDSTDTADHNLRGHINVRADSEEEAIEKAKKYLARTFYDERNVRDFQITDDRYINVKLVEEQIGREETKPNEMASDILKNKPENNKETEPENNTEVSVNINNNTETNDKENNSQEQVQDIEIKTEEDKEQLKESREDDEAQRAPWDTDFHRLDKEYNHNFKQFDDMEADSDVIRDFIDDLEAFGKDYDIYEHKTDPGCTIFFQESLNESCDGWVAFYNGKKLEITKNEADSLYDAKQKAIKELKVPKSKLGLLAIKPAYNESLNEDISWDDLNGTEQSAAEAALANIKNGSELEDAVHGAVAMYNDANSDEEYEDEEFYGEEADYTKVLDYVKNHESLTEAKKELPVFVKMYNAWPELMGRIMKDLGIDENDYPDLFAVPEDIQNSLIKEFLSEVKDKIKYEAKNGIFKDTEIPTAAIDMLKKYKNEILTEDNEHIEKPEEFSAIELRTLSEDNLETLLNNAPSGSIIHNIYENWWTKKTLEKGKQPTESIVKKCQGYKQNYFAPVPTKNHVTWWEVGGSEKYIYDLIKIILGKSKYYTVSDGNTFDFKESINEDKYTQDELFDKFGTDDLDIINAGNEKTVELAADDSGAIVEQLQKVLKRNKSLEDKVKALQEKVSVGYAKEMNLQEEIENYKQQLSKLSEKTKEIKVLTEKLAKAEKIIQENRKKSEGNISNLNESILSKDETNKKLKKNISDLNEAVDKKNSKIRSLNEQISKYKDQLSSKDNDIEQLKEQYETGQKDLEQLRNQYSKKIEQQNQIIEKYQRVAKNSVKRYIESQAVRLGVKSDEIINRLPKNYSFNDIDTICEDLQEYKFNMSNLPFGQFGLNENLKVTAKNIDKGLIEANPEDEITDYDLKIAEAFL